MNQQTRLCKAFNKEYIDRPPMWLMRQAGRYLPEYRELRKSVPSFLNLCYSPDLAAEVTLQPLRRFNFDVAILFSDILVIPDALGMDVKFVKGEGPVLNKPKDAEIEAFVQTISKNANNPEFIDKTLSPIYKTVGNVKENLKEDQALMGFCGAPWTVLLYMLDEKPSKSSERTRALAYGNPELFDALMDALVISSAHYLSKQIEAGADAVQIFDSWALQIPHALYERALKKPLYKLCRLLKEKHPETPILAFPRGVSESKLLDLVNDRNSETPEFNGLGLDYTVDMAWAVENLQDKICIQGNLDPTVMLSNETKIVEETTKLLKLATQKPGYIFNFGHGILPHVPVEHVDVLRKTVQAFKV